MHSPEIASPTVGKPKHRQKGLLSTTTLVVLIGISVAWFGIAAATAFGGHLPSLPIGSSGASNSAHGPSYLYLTIAFDPVNGLDQYFPANFSIPLNTPVVITITNYDTGTNVVPSMYSQVMGTSNNMMTYNDGVGGMPKMMSSVALASIGHTFTVMPMGHGAMMGGGGQAMLNVPIPAASNSSTPDTVTFTTTFTTAGDYTWMCLAPCDGTSMVTPGYMTGTVHVA